MRGFLFLFAALLVAGAASANAHPDRKEPERLDSVVVSTSRAGSNTPVTYTMLGKEQLHKSNPINSLPMNLNLQPSVVTYNEGGTGLGYSSMTVRGSKGSQINVTLNGITLNDSESQEVFWVNIPSLTNLISSVQLQRGLGTSANGAGAFGASVNMSTASVSSEPFAAVDFSGGSWNTIMTSAAVGTGIMKSGLYFNAAYYHGTTDGYIRNANVDSHSAFAVLGWLKGKNSLRLTWLMGKQKSGITWDGIDIEKYKEDRRYNSAGEYYDEMGNVHYYDNQTDNYLQNHLQLNYTHQFSDKWTWSNTFNYTRGDGYYEYYKEDRYMPDFGFDQEAESDMIYRKEMGNNYYVFSSDLRYRSKHLNLTVGAYLARYEGNHFGSMMWVKTLGDSYNYDEYNRNDGFYRNKSLKSEATFFARAEYNPYRWMTLYADLQCRGVSLDMNGSDDDIHESGLALKYDKKWNFFNPRAGVSFHWSPAHKAYVSVALGHREPGRGDIKENIKGDMSPIKPERMVDVEIGYEFHNEKVAASANLYLMEYCDMLLETGRLSSSGYAIKENVPRGWRRGVELAASWNTARWLTFDANLTLSKNEIEDYTSYVEVWDGEFGQTKAFNYGNTTMMMSPSVIGMLRMSLTPWKNSVANSLKTTTLSLDGKYVSTQYLDNTKRSAMEVPAYFVANLSLSHEFKLNSGSLGISAYVNNLFNHLYYASGWRWEGYTQADDTLTYGIGVYPQATTNYMIKVGYRF